jgi:hypothetical protein
LSVAGGSVVVCGLTPELICGVLVFAEEEIREGGRIKSIATTSVKNIRRPLIAFVIETFAGCIVFSPRRPSLWADASVSIRFVPPDFHGFALEI